jgi:hypothetical protein
MIESLEQQEQRWADLTALQEHYRDFRDFYYDCSVDLLGFEPTEQQLDIANFVAYGPHYEMVQAQRGEAKTTITGCYAVWSLIHDPTFRILIVSAGTPLAKQISTWCIQIINGMPELACLRVDTSHPGARSSVEAYDVHHTLKGANKSPSIACLGITSTSQGYRADLLIPDDVESKKNSKTANMREQLRDLTRDFVSINQKGRIVYLGTPQSHESIYNDLPARGFAVRIWPGRYPTVKEEANYGGHLAPSIVEAMEADPSLRTGGGPLGDRGQPTDPGMMSEEMLTKKEVDQGSSYFNLQHMLDTALSDAERYPLKVKDLMFYSFDLEEAPAKFTWSNDPAFIIPNAVGAAIQENIYRPAKVSDEFFPYTYKLLSIDPAGGGQNGDETGVSVVYANSNGWISCMANTGIPGGTDARKLEQVVQIAKKWDVHDCIIEKNYGYDAYPNAFAAACSEKDWPMSIDTVWASGQKELRIIDALEPVIGFHKLIINHSVLADETQSLQRYPAEQRQLFSLLFQIKHITRDRGSLMHDDRLESLSQAVTHLQKVIKQQHPDGPPPKPRDRFKGFQKDASGKWLFKDRVTQTQQVGGLNASIMDRFKR